MGGGLFQLIAYGAADIYFITNPSIIPIPIKAKIIDIKSDEECYICYECMTDKQLTRCNACNKLFDYECIDAWLKFGETCPICRRKWK